MYYSWVRRLLLAVLLLPVIGLAQSVEQARVRPNGGMWLPFKVEQKIEGMKSLGFQLGANDVYTSSGKSLHQGIVKLNGGSCTAEMISDQGLVLTNHHCAYDAIATLSSEASDYLTDGFWSKSFEEELPIPGGTAAYLVYSEDVTSQLIQNGEPIENMDAKAGEIEDEVRTRLGFEADYFEVEIEPVFEGMEFYLFVYKVYSDVRLVGAPPSSIGKFGFDTDNWIWPRHTGDFAMLRVYSDANNEPAAYAEENRPFAPPVHFPISLRGVEELDYAMIMGYPGSTSRYLTASDIKLALNQTNGDRIHLLGEKTTIMKAQMDQSDKVRIALASEYASLMNYYKYLIGQTTMMKRYDVPGEREEEEVALQAWIDADEDRKTKYGTLLSDIASLNEGYQQVDQFMSYLNFGIFSADAASFALEFLGLSRMLGAADEETIQGMTAELNETTEAHFKDYFYDIDKSLFEASVLSFYNNVPKDMHPAIFEEILNPAPAPVPAAVEEVTDGKKKKKKKKKDAETAVVAPTPVMPELSDEEKLSAWANTTFETSIFTDKNRATAFLANPTAEMIGDDPLMAYLQGVITFFRSRVGMAYGGYQNQITQLRSSHMKALREMHSDSTFYPDANSTMRFTYGQVLAYEPRDGVFYDYYTTLAGVMEKEDPTNEEFLVDEKLKELFVAADYGRYAAKDGKLHLCFLTNNDITGGNSGSPVLNSRGELIGCAFDGNWESMASDIYIFPQFNRTISVDIRYVLFVVDKFAGATRLIEEMTIVE